MKVSHVYMVMECSEKTEGRGAIVSTGISFESEHQALSFVMSRHYTPYAIMGVIPKSERDAKIYVREMSIYVFEDIGDYETEYEDLLREQIKAKALKKLSAKEREALGL